MDLRALRYFIETVRQNSFTLAAARLCVTQSTVSKMIRQLEDEVGQPLLIRAGRQVQLTDVGRVIFARGQEALELMQAMQREVADLNDLARGSLSVGMPPMVNLFFSPVVKAYCERYPGIRLTLLEGGGQRTEQQVASGELEVGVTLLPADPGLGLEHRSLGRFPLLVAGPAHAPWARAPQVALADLRDTPLVLPTDEFSLTHQLRSALTDAGVEARIAAQSSQWDFLVAMASAGLGTTLLPAPLLARLAPDANLAIRPLTAPGLAWHVALIWKRGHYLSHAARAWLALCADILTPAEMA
jgi:DNA-binding transcriptional LysR family regulator